jgi:hypothetical protein
LATLLKHGGDLAAQSSTSVSVMDVIFSHIPRPLHFLTDILNGSVIPNGASVNDRNFKVFILSSSLFQHNSSSYAFAHMHTHARTHTKRFIIIIIVVVVVIISIAWKFQNLLPAIPGKK